MEETREREPPIEPVKKRRKKDELPSVDIKNDLTEKPGDLAETDGLAVRPHGLDEWDPSTDPDFDLDETIMFLAQRRSGKTTLAAWMSLCKLRRLFPFVFVFTKTPHNNYWQQFVPADKVIDVSGGIDNEMIEAILRMCAERYSHYKEQKVITGSSAGNPIVLFIWEDCVTENSLRKLPAMERILFNGRHDGVASWILSQTLIGLSPAERGNLDRIIFWEPNTESCREWIRKAYGREVLQKLYDVVLSEKRRAFVVNNKSGIPVSEKYFTVKADYEELLAGIKKNLVMGNSAWWGDNRIEEQKVQYPYLANLPAKATLMARFNERVGEERVQEEANDDGPASLFSVANPTPEEQKAKMAEGESQPRKKQKTEDWWFPF